LPSVKSPAIVGQRDFDPAHRTQCRGLNRARAGFNDWDAELAHGALLRVVRRYLKGGEGDAGDADASVPPGAIDNGAGCKDLRAGSGERVDYVLGAAAGSDNVFDHEA